MAVKKKNVCTAGWVKSKLHKVARGFCGCVSLWVSTCWCVRHTVYLDLNLTACYWQPVSHNIYFGAQWRHWCFKNQVTSGMTQSVNSPGRRHKLSWPLWPSRLHCWRHLIGHNRRVHGLFSWIIGQSLNSVAHCWHHALFGGSRASGGRGVVRWFQKHWFNSWESGKFKVSPGRILDQKLDRG